MSLNLVIFSLIGLAVTVVLPCQAQDIDYSQYTNVAVLKISQDECLDVATKAVEAIAQKPPRVERGVVYGFAENNNFAVQVVCLKLDDRSVVSVNSVAVKSAVLSGYPTHKKIFQTFQKDCLK